MTQDRVGGGCVVILPADLDFAKKYLSLAEWHVNLDNPEDHIQGVWIVSRSLRPSSLTGARSSAGRQSI